MKVLTGDVVILKPFDVDTDKGVFYYTGGLATVMKNLYKVKHIKDIC